MSSNKSAKNKLIELYGEECFIEKDLIDKCYKDGDYHTMYVVEIENMLEK